MRGPWPLEIHSFGADPLSTELAATTQGRYLRCYLADLGTKSVIEERQYFDRDFLSEFAAFYGTSARGYENICRRLHFFSDSIERPDLERAVGGNDGAGEKLRAAYLGFAVIRPIPATPLGRTVLRAYPETNSDRPRVMKPSRAYNAHVAGFRLTVEGLAWQQQDSAVGACATVALWTILHSSAFDDHHAIPTTAALTRLANRTPPTGARTFPSAGLTPLQLGEAVKECGLVPMMIATSKINQSRFELTHLASSIAACVRSGYPVLLAGDLERRGRHAVCVVGFRDAGAPFVAPGDVALQDANVSCVYVHDDNLGPSVRFRLFQDESGFARLAPAPPEPRHAAPCDDPTRGYPDFLPSMMFAAVHEDLRTSANKLHEVGQRTARALVAASGKHRLGFSVSTRFIRLARYLDEELGSILSGDEDLLSRVRLALCETVPPMSLHIGLVRIGLEGRPVLDVLYDTSDSDRSLPVFCHVGYEARVLQLAAHLSLTGAMELGTAVDAS